jgi:putative heme-binding domain-containing protein
MPAVNLLTLGLLLLLSIRLSAAEIGPGVSSVQLEALKRLQGVDLETNPTLKAAVLRILEATRGTPQFVELVEQFKLTGQSEGLLEVALKHPAEEAGVRAMRLILEAGDLALIRTVLEGSEPRSVACVQALGNTRLPTVNELVLPLLSRDSTSDAVRRETIKALAKNEPGAQQLLMLAKADRLEESLRLTAATALSQVSWADVRAAATEVLPLPRAGGDEVLPPISELMTRRGDPVNGRRVFFSDITACQRCHVVNGEGIAIGPDLSQIGDKLGKDALLEAILDPNNGIAFGYEAWTVTTTDDEEIYGLIVSETADELAVKDLSGIVHRIAKGRLADRVPSKFSLMPAGLQATMSVKELVDLVEYMSQLKKVPAP